MKVYLKRRGEINLTQKEFVAKGGEGSIYVKDGLAFKIYSDPSNMIPYGKMKELSVLDLPEIITPKSAIRDSKDNIIGYTMDYVKDTYSLSALFTKSFRKRNNVDNDIIIDLIKMFKSMIEYIHSKGVLVVDLNELNFLVSCLFKTIYAIDVNSYQTENFPATVIMPSVQDRHCNNVFSEGTDWFSWGIVTCRMLMGIHPYRGNHPDFTKYAADQRMSERMRANVSIFHHGVTLPGACQPFDVIPEVLRNWYIEVFENGMRGVPPDDFFATIKHIVTKIKKIVGSDLFDISEDHEYADDILDIYYQEGTRVTVTANSIFVNHRELGSPFENSKTKICFTPKMDRVIAACIVDGVANIYNVSDQKEIDFNCSASDVMTIDGRMYLKNGTSILEMNLIENNGDVIAGTKKVGSVLDVDGATRVYDGVIIQNLLGKWYASIFPKKGHCYQIKLDDLDDYDIVDGKFENNVLVIVAVDRVLGSYDRFVMRFNDSYADHDVRKTEGISNVDLNFTVGDQGAVVLIGDGKLELFHNKYEAGSVQDFDDSVIDDDMRLYHDGARILFTRNKKIYRISVAKNK